jgi:hypothetical protein
VNQQFDQPNPVVENKTDFYEAKARVPETGYEMIYSHECGGVVWRHELVNLKGIDYKDLEEVAIDKAKLGCEVHLLPTLAEGHPLRSEIFPNAKERKCPDLKINGEYVEVKIPIDELHWRKINNNIRLAHSQADKVIIKLNAKFSSERLAEITKGRFLSHRNLQLVEFKMAGAYLSFRREDFVKNEGSH